MLAQLYWEEYKKEYKKEYKTSIPGRVEEGERALLFLFMRGVFKMTNELITAIGNFGFPIVVSVYLLVRIEGKLAELTCSITELAKAVAVLKVN